MSIDEKSPSGTKSLGGAKMSVLQPYSVGEAVANIQVGQTELMVRPTEKQTHLDGEATDIVTDTTTSGKDSQGGAYSDVAQSGVAIKASWLSRNPWLKFPGLVRRGEEVQIWRVGDSDQYYWELMGTSNHLRRKDIMLLVFSNTRDEETTELTSDNSVFFTIDTVDKHITLSTPTNDKELTAFMLQLNYGDSNFSISNTKGDTFLMDTPKALMLLKNSADTLVKLEGSGVDIEASKYVKIKTDVFEVDAPKMLMHGDQGIMKYTNLNMTGSNLALAYASTVGGQGGGTFTFNGASVDFNVSSITHGGKTIDSNHTHSKVQSGNGTSGPVS